jgi:protein-disulfide isomerase
LENPAHRHRRLSLIGALGLAVLVASCSGIGSSEGPPAIAAAPETVAERGEGEPLQLIENPTLADILKPGPLPEHTYGRSDAPVVLIEYVSHTCPYCRAFHEKALAQIKRDYLDKGRVRLIVREFPIGKASGVAAIANACIGEQKHAALLERYLKEQARWVAQEVRHDAIFEVAAKEGLTRAQFDACLSDKRLIDGLKWVKERGRQLGVIGTPTFFVQAKRLKPNPSLEALRAELDQALAPAGASAQRAAAASSQPQPRVP